MWNGGKMDQWNTARDPGFGMGIVEILFQVSLNHTTIYHFYIIQAYFDRTDMPYYWALADAFTIGDQYYQVL